MKKKIFYWSPCLNHVGTVISTLNSAIGLCKYNKNYDSMKIHRMLSWVHFSGMAIIPYLGYKINQTDDYNAAVKTHQVIALSTLGTMILSALLSFLPY